MSGTEMCHEGAVVHRVPLCAAGGVRIALWDACFLGGDQVLGVRLGLQGRYLHPFRGMSLFCREQGNVLVVTLVSAGSVAWGHLTGQRGGGQLCSGMTAEVCLQHSVHLDNE